MKNPILAALGQNRINQIMQIKKSLNGQNPEAIYNMLYQNNPQFRNFITSNKGKSLDQIARENGIDIDSILNN